MIGSARHAGSGARTETLYLIAIASRRTDQLDLPLSACAVIHQHGGASPELAFHRLLFNDNLRRADSARSKRGSEGNSANNEHSHGCSRSMKLPAMGFKILLL
jgi:hypothetical protein